MGEKNTMVFYHDWIPLLQAFAPNDALKIIFALAKYDQTGVQPALAFKTPLENAVYGNMVDTVTRNRESYAKKCEKNRNNGLKGGRPKNQTVTKETERLFEKPNGFKSHDNDNDADADSEPVNDSDTVNDIEVGTPSEPQQRPLDELQDNQIKGIIYEWNCSTVTKNVNGIHHLSTRENNTRLCLGRCSFQQMLDLIRSLEHQAWFRKRKEANDPVTYDWFIKPDNFQKVLEGNYREEHKPKKAADQKKTKFQNFDERVYDDDYYAELERKMTGG